MIRLTFITLLVAVLMACNSTAEQDTTLKISCDSQDWQTLGYVIATSGKSVREFDHYIEQCGESLQAQAKSLYSLGYEQGLVDYCTYENGYAIGKSQLPSLLTPTEPVDHYCTYELKDEFERGLKVGRVELNLKNQTLEYYREQLETQQQIRNDTIKEVPSRGGN